ncbi:MAG: RimK family protein [Leptospiraceae bacterium]|nr:RimK family protein [Leptospiraceae bacterium]MCP5513150.1 RimK family protein [Leptospiraceae bacterium]
MKPKIPPITNKIKSENKEEIGFSYGSEHLILVENLSDWKKEYPHLQVITVNEYLKSPEYFKMKNAKVINLCRSYRYLSRGYYCSLLAEARKHKIIPSVRTLRDLSSKSVYKLDTESLDSLLQKIFSKGYDSPYSNVVGIETYIFFGLCDYPILQELARQIFETFRCPLLRVEFRFQEKWQIGSLKPLSLNSIPKEKQELFVNAIHQYCTKRWYKPKAKSNPRYDLAILYNPDEKFPPSSKQALKNFIKAGKQLNVEVELIQKRDYSRLSEFDALFIRETTAIEHHTYLFAKKAQSEGIVVIDDPDSILRCTNKVFLAELLMGNKIPIPKTVILLKDNLDTLENEIPYPIVLKIPEGAFSLGVYKANNRAEMLEITGRLFKESDIILAQEYMYTEFDWRIGILNKKPLFASQYFMSKEHWQVINHNASSKSNQEGDTETHRIEDVPEEIIRVANEAANLIGDGLYGVDMKYTSKGPCIIEINDNPNIDDGTEDYYLKDELYRTIIKDFIRRIENK